MGFNADSVNSKFLALNDRRAGPAKWIQDALPRLETKAIKVMSDQMRRVRQHEPIPPMRGAIRVINLIEFDATLTRQELQLDLGHLNGNRITKRRPH